MGNQATGACLRGSALTGSPCREGAAKMTVRNPFGASTPQAPWMIPATFSDAGSTVNPVSSFSSWTAVAMTDSPLSAFPEGRSQWGGANFDPPPSA